MSARLGQLQCTAARANGIANSAVFTLKTVHPGCKGCAPSIRVVVLGAGREGVRSSLRSGEARCVGFVVFRREKQESRCTLRKIYGSLKHGLNEKETDGGF